VIKLYNKYKKIISFFLKKKKKEKRKRKKKRDQWNLRFTS
jgi:hypothetical protein